MEALQKKEKLEALTTELISCLEDKEMCSEIDDNQLQQLLSTLIKIYAAKLQTGSQLLPVSTGRLNQTDTSIFVDQLLKAMEVELFEVQIWRSLGSHY